MGRVDNVTDHAAKIEGPDHARKILAQILADMDDGPSYMRRQANRIRACLAILAPEPTMWIDDTPTADRRPWNSSRYRKD